MSAPEIGKRVRIYNLNQGQAVPCDGRVYRDKYGQLWFGILHPLEEQRHYVRLLREIAWHEKQRELDEDAS